jgi:hypothetical protein
MTSLRALPAFAAIALGAIASLATAGCAPPVDCAAVCERTLACEVSFQPPDDPAEERVERGERTELESCTLGCQASPLVDEESAACISTLDTRDANVCQADVLDCLGAGET